MNINIWQIYFDKASSKGLQPLLLPFFNTDQSKWWFENQVLLDLYNADCFVGAEDYVGVTSWRLEQKTGFTGPELIAAIEADNGEHDAYWYSTDYMFCQAPNITTHEWMEEFIFLLNKHKVLPFKITEREFSRCWCNYFVTRPDIMSDYIQHVLSPAMDFFNLSRHCADLRKLTTPHRGKDYPIASFLMETMFGFYMQHNNISRKQLISKAFETKSHPGLTKFYDKEKGEKYYINIT